MKKDQMYIEVAVALPVNKTFTYHVPEHLAGLAVIGKRALAPFGRRTVSGYILSVSRATDIDAPKSIIDILDHQPLFPPVMVRLFRWLADYYFFPLGLVIKNALPGGLNIHERPALSITATGQAALKKEILTPMERLALTRLSKAPASTRKLEKAVGEGASTSLVPHLLKRGWVTGVRTLKQDRVRVKMERFATLIDANIPAENISSARRKIIDRLREEGALPIRALKADQPTAPSLVRKMAEDGYVSITSQRIYRDPLGEPIQGKAPPNLTHEQKTVVGTIDRSVGRGFAAFLLAGVTGSGKTEVYLRLSQTTLDQGLAVLVLVPEISLISQMERRFRARFGDRVAVLHSGLSAGEKLDQWQKIMNREFEIAIGARSAVFAPFGGVGLIIVDEEHDTSYKQEGTLRYNARDLAIVRAQQQNAVALLGSATPSIQSYHNAMGGKYKLVSLTHRVEQQQLPDITVVDLCLSRDQKGWRRYFSEELLGALRETMARNEQAILFLNRRGFANFPVCGSCGRSIQCKNCDISLTFHQKHNAYKCHYCGFAIPSVSTCPACGSQKIHHLGVGTEKIEATVKELFPDKQVQRMDRDTTTRKGVIVKMLKGLKNREIDILVGTQMVTKGHDFPGITLVGIICADLSLSFPDFRAGERTFQLLAQVAGRAGRGNKPGRVVLQTYNPDHFSIQCAQHQDFHAFYSREIKSRKTLDYPPFSRMIQIKISSRDQSKGRRQAETMGELARNVIQANPLLKKTIRIFGPLESPFPRIASRYRWQLLIKGLHLAPLREFMQKLLRDTQADHPRRDVTIAVDVDPFFMM
jgi:primosomal protein N' (replication factor Y)